MNRKNPPSTKIFRRSGRIYFGEGEQQWSAPDPIDPSACSPELLAGVYHHLVYVCPDTYVAIAKLRLIRWAVRNAERY